MKPDFASDAANAGPTPGRIVTGLSARKACASSAPITEKPRGLSRSEAILAKTLLGARPTEIVSPVSCSIRACTFARVRAGAPPCRRSEPERSTHASSRLRGCTRGVSERSVSMMRPDSKTYFEKSGRMTTASGHSFSALYIGMAERGP